MLKLRLKPNILHEHNGLYLMKDVIKWNVFLPTFIFVPLANRLTWSSQDPYKTLSFHLRDNHNSVICL